MTRATAQPLRSLLAGAILAVLSPHVVAETPEHLNLETLDRPGYTSPNAKVPFQLPEVPPSVAPPALQRESAIMVKRIAFSGNTVAPTAELDALSAPYVGRVVKASQLEELRQKLTKYYVDRGYVNSGAMPARKLADEDALVFEIIEGRLKGIRLHGLDGLDEDYVTARLAGHPAEPLNVDVLRERFQLLLSDPLFFRANAKLVPDAKLGEAFLDVGLERARPYRLSIYANNYRPPSIGANVLGLNGLLQNMTGRGDVLSANAEAPANGDPGLRGSLAWQIPLNYRGTQLYLQVDHGNSTVMEEPVRILEIKSILDSQSIGLSQTFSETLAQKLSVGFNWVERKNRTWLLGKPFSFVPGEPNGVIKAPALRLWQEFAYRSELQVLAFRSTFSFVRTNLEEISGLPLTAQPDKDYRLWLGQVQYARKLANSEAQIILRGNLQTTPDSLLPLDGMSIGGVGTVRGYRENQLIRDNGRTFSAELDFPMRRGTGGTELHVIPFYDYGRGSNKGGAADTLSSVGIAARIQWLGVKAELAIAKRLDSLKQDSSNKNLQDKGIHFQLSYDM